MTVIEASDSYAYTTRIANDDLFLAYFTASWCGPCKMMAPKVDELSTSYPDVDFLKIDIDRQHEVAQMAMVTAVPTFHLYKGGVKVGEMVGADPAKLKQLLETNSQ
ncbi:thioredoxine 2 [Blastocladiella britannica]|nr:thioredoxine 2 [Blastocladiella britannica]